MVKTNNLKNKDCFERMNYLYQASNLITAEHKESNESDTVAHYYSNLVRNIAKKSVLRLDVDLKRTLCKKCNGLMIPGMNCRVRIRKRQSKTIQWTCLKCFKIKRFHFKKEKRQNATVASKKPLKNTKKN